MPFLEDKYIMKHHYTTLISLIYPPFWSFRPMFLFT